MSNSMPFIHSTADVSENAKIGLSTKIWNYSQIREHANIGSEVIIGKNVYIDFDVIIGNRCKIQNNCSIFHGAVIDDGVFIGPHVIITNDKNPRAINSDGTLKKASDWEVGKTHIAYGASIGAGSVILPNVNIGRFALIGAGSIVTKDVPEYALVAGNPAKIIGTVDTNGTRIS